MSKLEKIKTQIDFLSYKFRKDFFEQAIITIIGIAIDIILLFIAIKYTLKKIYELEDL